MRYALCLLAAVMLLSSSTCSRKTSPAAEPVGIPATLNNAEMIGKLTASPGATASSFTFVAVGDCRDGWDTYERVLAQAQEYDPSFILVLGDFVPTGLASEYEAYARLIEKYPLPMVHIPGNHEVIKGLDNYLKYVGAWNWHFDYGGVRFVGIDNSSLVFEESAVDYLREHLHAGQLSIVAYHEPLSIDRWAVHSVRPDDKGGRGGEISAILEATDPRLVLNGHIHLYDEMSIAGIPHVISGGGGSPLHTTYGFGRPEYGMLVVRVNGGFVDHEWIPLDD